MAVNPLHALAQGDPGRERLRADESGAEYLFVYPMVKTRPWYALPREERRLRHISKPLKRQMRDLIDRTRWPVLVTYSDEGQGHLGHVYKCSGWQKTTRKRAQVLSVAIVGYTNAGKSTLFNRLARESVYAANQLFATLDTTTRRVHLPAVADPALANVVVLSDTVGFIRDLPPTLVASFRATLEETVQADLLLHVVDASSPTQDAQMAQVDLVLTELGAGVLPQVIVLNKADLTALPAGVERDEYGRISRLRVSAKTGAGMDFVRLAIDEFRSGSTLPDSSSRAVA
jgi:tRNA U34 5-carboxymethylaminomethyl modifying GTPase MnmE/TrmE